MREMTMDFLGAAPKRAALIWAALLFFLPLLRADANPGDEVAIVFNESMPESKDIAQYYAQKRNVPRSQIFGLKLPKTEAISRDDFKDRLQKPLAERFRKEKLWTFSSEPPQKGGVIVPASSKIRYLVLCYGVPLKILPDPKLREKGVEEARAEMQRNEAAVDSELVLLPMSEMRLQAFGPLANRLYGATNALWLNPTNGVLIVARLDGPAPEIARGLVDKALRAEEDGLCGRAYFDTRGITNGAYHLGDEWLRESAQLSRRIGLETVIDKNPGTFAASFPMSQIALYAGWYDGAASGPFTRPEVEFMPGAVAYHLHSYSARTIRSSTANWVGPLLAKGAAATMGCTEEPYLDGTPDLAVFFSRLFFGFTFGEAACASQRTVSWQTTVVGDPLYRPFARTPPAQHAILEKKSSPLLEWSHLRFVNFLAQNGEQPPMLIEYLSREAIASRSAILQEKLGDLLFGQVLLNEAIEAYSKALQLNPTPQQKIRLCTTAALTCEMAGRFGQAFEFYEKVDKEFPDYPDKPGIYRRLADLAGQVGKTAAKARYEKELERLSPAPAAAPHK